MKRAPYATWLAISGLALGFTLSGCATAPRQPIIKTVAVYLPTPVSCIPPDSPGAPIYADTAEALKAAKDYAERDALVKGEWAKHRAREAYLESLRAICMKVSP